MIEHGGAPVSIGVIAFTVFVLGLRHGADPDHLAAIDNLTRNSLTAGARFSRFVGTLFAGGHSIMVLSIAALAGLLGSRLATHGALLETIGTWVSIVTLFAIAGFNIRQLSLNRIGAMAGVKTALLPRRCARRPARSPRYRSAALRPGLRHLEPGGDIRARADERRRHRARAYHRVHSRWAWR